MRPLLVSACLLLATCPAAAQEWRPFEIDVPEDMANSALEKQQAAARSARRYARTRPEPPAESLGEAWSRLERTLVRANGARVHFAPDRLILVARVSIFAIVTETQVSMRFEFQPRVPSPNVIELRAVGGSERWGRDEWETSDASKLSYNVKRLVKQLNDEPGDLAGKVRHERGRDGEPDRVLIDLCSVQPLHGVEVLEIRVAEDVLTMSGRSSLERLEIEANSSDMREGLRAIRQGGVMPEINRVLGPGSWLDIGREVPGRITLHSTADLPWLPKVDYRAVFALERAGPLRLRLILEDIHIGKGRVDRFLGNTRTGKRIKAWLLRKIFERMNQEEPGLQAAYAREELDARVSHDPAHPEVRILDLRPRRVGGLEIRPGYSVDSVSVEPGRVRISASLTSDPLASPAAPAPGVCRSPGLSGALTGARN